MGMNASIFSLMFLKVSAPITILAVGAMIAMMQSVFKSIGQKGAIKGLLFGILAAALVVSVSQLPLELSFYSGGTFISEGLGRFGTTMILGIGLVTAILFNSSFMAKDFFRGEISALFQIVLMGALVAVSADDLITVFVGLEMASIGIYALIGYTNPNRISMEGAIKYFILGGFASAFLLFGIALLYVSSGSLVISEIMNKVTSMDTHPWVLLGALFLFVGLAFKFALAPFHLWAPDAYEGAPTGLTAFMATAVKVMILILFLRFMIPGMGKLGFIWQPALFFVASMSMIFGNLLGLVQTGLKRMLAYSSVAHGGYMAVALAAITGKSSPQAVMAVLFYLIAYTILSLGAFGIIMWFESSENDNLQIEDVAGLGRKHPYACGALALFMFALAGFPPMAGFIGKFFVFGAALNQGLYGLVIMGVIGSCLSLYYYLRVIVKIFLSEPSSQAGQIAPKPNWALAGIVGLAVVFSLMLGTVWPETVLNSMKVIALQQVPKNNG